MEDPAFLAPSCLLKPFMARAAEVEEMRGGPEWLDSTHSQEPARLLLSAAPVALPDEGGKA